MRDKCEKMDKTIERYRALALRVMDEPTIDGIQKLTADLEAQKRALHPEQYKKGHS
jgi:hypothetical protein